ncbi:hypothetical protein H0H92_014545, partial [Tricholoma furcatifolium]
MDSGGQATLDISTPFAIANDRDAVIDAQKRILDVALQPLNIRLNWAPNNHFMHADWFPSVDEGTREEKEMTDRLRRGGPGALNIYTVKLSGGSLGYSYFPDEWDKVKTRDGIFINYQTVPGGGLTNYDSGM